jgi:radical SAM protein with 4Fe4S-binding SPASM domain
VQTPGAERLERLGERGGTVSGVHLQLADRCNHSCGHCYQVQGQKGELPLADVRRILDDLAAAGVLVLSLSGGEITLREDLPEILRYARAKHFAIRLYSNAYAIDDALVDVIADAKILEMHVSVYSDREDEHDAVTRVPGSLQRTLDSIRRLRARGVRVIMKTPLLSLAPGARQRVEALAESLGCGHASDSAITPREDGSTVPLELQASDAELLAQEALHPWLPPENADEQRREKLADAPCGVCATSVAVMPNGEVRACTDTLVPLGNLTRQRLREVMKSPEVGLFRRLKWGDVHGCRDCDLLLACTRCHATASHQAHDYLGPYPFACARARARYAAGLSSAVHVIPRDCAEPASPPSLGPYRIEAPGLLRAVEDVSSPEDLERVRRFEWIRPSADYEGQRLSAGGKPVRVRRSRNGDELQDPQSRVPPCAGE